MERHRHLIPLSRIAILVALADYASKALASRLLSAEPMTITSWLNLGVVHNEGGAFGMSLGAYTWQLNLALTMAAIVFVIPVVRDLARVDSRAPMALGLIAGGALGNLGSLVLPPRGVMDFIGVRFGDSAGLVLNMADVAAYIGLAMIARTGFLIVAEMRRSLRPESGVPISDALQPAMVAAPVVQDREVLTPVFREMPQAALADGPSPRLPLTTVSKGRKRPTRVLQFPSSIAMPVDGDGAADVLRTAEESR